MIVYSKLYDDIRRIATTPPMKVSPSGGVKDMQSYAKHV